MKNYQTIIFEGATFPDDPYRHISIHLNDTMTREYIPALGQAIPEASKGLRLLATAMAIVEGFKAGDNIPYRTHNPGNIGNTDSGATRKLATLADGIKLQASYLKAVAAGTDHHYIPGHEMHIAPFHIPHAKSMGLPEWAPGYHFTYNGQLDQFLKIYSTGARATNLYVNTIVSYFADNGLTITPAMRLADIIAMN